MGDRVEPRVLRAVVKAWRAGGWVGGWEEGGWEVEVWVGIFFFLDFWIWGWEGGGDVFVRFVLFICFFSGFDLIQWFGRIFPSSLAPPPQCVPLLDHFRNAKSGRIPKVV